jgi:hypothetical protein
MAAVQELETALMLALQAVVHRTFGDRRMP